MRYEEITVKSWRDLMEEYQGLANAQHDWVFRGHRESAWELESTLERSIAKRFRVPLSELSKIEWSLIRSFQRGSHLYLEQPPAPDDLLEWLSVMQHYGAPTRMLDWSYSFYVAVFFALEQAYPGMPCAIWAINFRWLLDAARTQFSDDAKGAVSLDPRVKRADTVQKIFASGRLVFPFNPFRMNERLRLQQGLFIAASDLTVPFEDNLFAITEGKDCAEQFKKIVLEFDLAELKLALTELRRMNLTAETLFPGVDGFARGLHQKITIRELDVRAGDAGSSGFGRS